MNIVDEATNTVITENGPISLGTDNSQKPGSAKKKLTKPTKLSQILKLSNKGLTPLEISTTLGVQLHYVYTARSQMKAKGIGRWHQAETVKQQKAPTQADFDKEAAKVNKYFDEVRRSNQIAQIIFVGPEPFSLPFFSRIKAAYAVLRGKPNES